MPKTMPHSRAKEPKGTCFKRGGTSGEKGRSLDYGIPVVPLSHRHRMMESRAAMRVVSCRRAATVRRDKTMHSPRLCVGDKGSVIRGE